MGGAISWRSHLQECISLSTTKATYVIASEAYKEVDGFPTSLRHGHIPQLVPILFCDNQSAIALAKNQVYPAKTEHIGE